MEYVINSQTLFDDGLTTFVNVTYVDVSQTVDISIFNVQTDNDILTAITNRYNTVLYYLNPIIDDTQDTQDLQ